MLNPLVDDANVSAPRRTSNYHSFSVDLRRRLSRGLFANVNYAWARQWGSTLAGPARERFNLRQRNVPHAFKTTFSYEIPVGRGRRFGTDMSSCAERGDRQLGVIGHRPRPVALVRVPRPSWWG